jgi:YHS domain-containing protein
MTFLARFLRFVVWVLIISWGFRVVGRVAAWALKRAANPGEAQNVSSEPGSPGEDSAPRIASRQLVRDPVCGMHLAETLAIPFRDHGALVHFCSAECRDKYASGSLQRAANA